MAVWPAWIALIARNLPALAGLALDGNGVDAAGTVRSAARLLRASLFALSRCTVPRSAAEHLAVNRVCVLNPPRRAVRTSGGTPTAFRPAGRSQTLSPWLNYEFESPPNTKMKPPPAGAPTLLSALSGHQHLKMLDLRNNRLDGTAGSVIGRVRLRWMARADGNRGHACRIRLVRSARGRKGSGRRWRLLRVVLSCRVVSCCVACRMLHVAR